METLRYVLLANGLLAVVVVAYYVLLRRETFFAANRAALWLGLTASVGLPLLQLPDYRPEPVRAVMQQTAQRVLPKLAPAPPTPDVTITYPNQRTYRAFTNAMPQPGWSWPNWVLLAYGAVALSLMVRFVGQLWSLRRLLRQSEHEPYDDFVLVRNANVASPFSFFRYVVVNPDRHTPDELEQILRHERVHVRAWHSVDMVIAELLCIVGWFNPAVYLFRHLLHQTLEFQADRAVLAEGVDARAYQYNLVKVSLSVNQPGLTNSFSKSFLKQRIVMMNRTRSKRWLLIRYVALCLCVSGFGIACQKQVDYTYVKSRNGTIYGLITARTTQSSFDTLRQVLLENNISLTVDTLMHSSDGRISRIALSMQVPKPGHPISTTVGGLSGRMNIPSFGLRCNANQCQIGPIDESFPASLQLLAQRENTQFFLSDAAEQSDYRSTMNLQSGVYRVFFRNDFLESSFMGLRQTAIHVTPDFHLDTYPEYRKAIIFIDGQEVSREQLHQLDPLNVKKLVVYEGKAAVYRFGDERAKQGLILITRFSNRDVYDRYAGTPMLEIAYPDKFAKK
ncbi:M56 family metallopeptidase [Spirosoma montaniterrae]|uniref:M56 family metallopeptidase n=1 Tax=Spirosoma montaniterrae TaxID=1178516 RepID=UPI00097D2750|nr:M56 family metallopeptidase [Spirosoma montaniterrae]